MQDSITRITTSHLSELAHNQAMLIDESIRLHSQSAAIAAGGDSLAEEMRAWKSGLTPESSAATRTIKSTALSSLQARGARLLEQGFLGVVYRLPDNRSLQIGRMIVSPPMRTQLHEVIAGELIWDGGYFISTSVPIRDERGVVGEMLAQQSLPMLDRLSREAAGESETGVLVLCTPVVQVDSANCFPMRNEPSPFTVPLTLPATAAQPPNALARHVSPMAEALAGRSGTIMTRDYRGVPVIAAYRPLRNASLGLVLKADTVESYEPLRRSLEVALPLTVGVILISLWVMQWRLKPLVEGLVHSRDQIRQLALHDPLTGLPNRTLMNDRLQMAFSTARRSNGFVALGLVDVDGFKQVNDVLGHEAGDELLKMIADRLVESVRASDTVARLGGDEFVIIFPDVLVPGAALDLANKTLAVFSKPVDFQGMEYSIRLSIGFAVSTSGNDDGELIMRQADAAMYLAKESGGNRVEIFDPLSNRVPAGNPTVGTETHSSPNRRTSLQTATASKFFD